MSSNDLHSAPGEFGTPHSRRPARFSLYKVLARPGRLLAVATLAVLVAGSVTGCGNQNGGPGGGQHAGNGGGPGKGPSQPPVPVAVEMAQLGSISSYYTATATLAPEKEAEMLARVTGVVDALECEEGDLVTRGDVLLRIEGSEFQYRLRQAEANTASLKDRYSRLDGMFEQQLVSAEEFEAAKNELAAAEAAEDLARLDLSHTVIRAPFTGAVVRRLVDVGQNVSAGTSLFVVSDFNPLLAIVHVPSKEFKKLKPDQPVQLLLDSNKDRLQGRIKLVSPIIDPSSGTIKVTIEIVEYPKNTRPGDFAEVSIVTERREGRTLIPKTAVFTDRGDQIVYVAADSTAERRVVEVGFEDDAYAEILDGVSDGEPIIVKGQRSLKHGSPIKILGDAPVASPAPDTTSAEHAKKEGS